MFDDILKSIGVDPKSLNYEEVATLEKWAEMYQHKTLTLSDIKDHLTLLIESVERELAGVKPPDNIVAYLFRGKRDVYLKARLYNYIMLRDFINQPDKMLATLKKALETKKHVLKQN